MGTISSAHMQNHSLTNDSIKDGIRTAQSGPKKTIQDRRSHLRRLQGQDPDIIERIALGSRVLIIEGISGSGKDTFQRYLKRRLKNRDVYDYSEGEVLHSWKQFQIEGILELRVKFMKLFVNYVRDIISRDENAVFLLNRFHLSTYAWTVIQQQKLGTEYDEIIETLKLLPVHVFILHVDDSEIEERSLHPERSSAWQKFQKQIVKNYNFYDRLERQQKLILEAARIQQLPHSVIKIAPYQSDLTNTQISISRMWAIASDLRAMPPDAQTSERKRPLAQSLRKHS